MVNTCRLGACLEINNNFGVLRDIRLMSYKRVRFYSTRPDTVQFLELSNNVVDKKKKKKRRCSAVHRIIFRQTHFVEIMKK